MRYFKIPEANLVFTDRATQGAGERMGMHLRVRQANMHVLVHLDAKFRIRRSILGKFRSNFDLEGHTGREFEWYEYLGTDFFSFFF